jgi:hypothetical protein
MNSRYLHTISFAILMAASATSFADTPPPKKPFDSFSWKASLKEKATEGITMGSLHVKFEQTTLDDVRRAASAGKISLQGDDGESIFWLCYTNLNSSQVERIWVISHGEMGGSTHSVTSISAQLLPGGKSTSDCPALPANMQPLALDNHLWLNSPESDVLKLGAPSDQKEPWRSYNYEGKVPGDCEGGGFDLLNWLLMKVGKGRVTTLHAGQVTSC